MSILFASLTLAAATLVPLNDLGPQPYLWGYYGGLFEHGSNEIPADHLAGGLAMATRIQPLDATGKPSPDGKIVMMSVGYGNTSRTFEQFKAMAATAPRVDREHLVMVNAAGTGIGAKEWDQPWDWNYTRIGNSVLPAAGVSPKQVQVLWVQLINEHPFAPMGIQYAEAYQVKGFLSDALRMMKNYFYPNLQIAYLSSTEYGGYDTGDYYPEPFAYESAFSVRWVIEGQLSWARTGGLWDTRVGDVDYTRGSVPWVTWGPYLWANGETPRSDGLAWYREDFEADGANLSAAGARKSGAMLFNFMMKEPTAAKWFRTSEIPSRRRAVKH